MASRENQGLQIALIIFLMITVGLAISTYYFFRQAEEATKTAEASDAKAKTADLQLKSKIYQLEHLKLMVGVEGVTQAGVDALKGGLQPDDGIKQIDALRAQFDADMALLGDNLDPKERNWKDLPKKLLTSLIKRSTDVVAAVDASKKTQTEKTQLAAQEQGRVTAAETAQAAAVQDVANQLKTFTTSLAEATKQKDDLEQQLGDKTKETADKLAAADKKFLDEKEKVSGLQAEVREKQTKLRELQNESFEKPHGQITWVNLRNNTCYINLGRADGLQRQVTFSVFDPTVRTLTMLDPAEEKKTAESLEEKKKLPKRKASIEVTEVLDDHLAECRILEDDVKNPLLPGDNVFTPAWRPGQFLTFALVGRLDLDQDATNDKADREKVKNLIMANGGKIVCEVLENGKREGKIDINTRYVVVGEQPEEIADESLRTEYTNILGLAERNGVQRISLKDLLAKMGYKGTDKTVKLGTAGAANVEKKKESPTEGEKFRPRPKPAAADAF